MHGYLNSENVSDAFLANATFDELYFESSDGIAASLDFNFNFNFSVRIIDTTKSLEPADTSLTLQLWGDHKRLDRKTFKFKSETNADTGKYSYFFEMYYTNDETPDETINMVNGAFDFSRPINLSTDGWLAINDPDIDGLVQSGTYLPITVDMFVEGGTSVIDSDNPYDAFDENDNKLEPTAFTLASIENFDQPRSAAVPEPATFILFGSGLVGFAARRRKAQA